jgi:hypothetical protein
MPVACKFLPDRERFLKCFDDFLAVFRSLFTALQCLDFSADRPIGDHHAGVDGPDKFSPGLLQKGDDRSTNPCGACIISSPCGLVP